MKVHLAIDLGAESGRVIAVWIANDSVHLWEAHRFYHQPVELPTGLHWNVAQIWTEILNGLSAAAVWAKDSLHELVSIGCDAWGVDWVLIDSAGELVALPHAYRDPRNDKFYEEAISELGIDTIYQTTGIQMMAINSLYSLLAMTRTSRRLVDAAEKLLFIPDLIHFWLCGYQANEQTIASTSQMVDIRTGQWAFGLISRLGIPSRIFGRVSLAGADLGKIRKSVAAMTGLAESVRVIAPGSHDTASAVAAVPAVRGGSWCYLSSGTWSLLGAELRTHCTNAAAQAAMFTNEAGVGGTIRFLKNIAGLWLVQECRRHWQKQGNEYTYQQLTEWATAEESGRTIVDPKHVTFLQPGQMPQKIADFARQTSQPIPGSPGQFVRCCLDSLAVAYQQTLTLLEQTLNRRFETLHIVGGGGHNELLNQLTADVVQRSVVVGPLEATAIGNGLFQAIACGEIAGLNEMRDLIGRGDSIAGKYEPQPGCDLIERADRLKRATAQGVGA